MRNMRELTETKIERRAEPWLCEAQIEADSLGSGGNAKWGRLEEEDGSILGPGFIDHSIYTTSCLYRGFIERCTSHGASALVLASLAW